MKNLSLVTTFSAALLGTIALSAQVQAQIPESAAVQPAPMPTLAVQEGADSAAAAVRIVRLSSVEGKVLLDRGVNHGYEPAFANLPIVQGSWLKTSDGLAEVEFEDNSSMRMTPNTIVQFTQLTRDATGGTVSAVNVIRGTVYVSLANTKANTFMLTANEGHFDLLPASHIQFHEGAPLTTLSVIAGSVDARVGSSSLTVTQKKSLEFKQAGDLGNLVEPVEVSHLEKGDFDTWDKNSVVYHKQFMNTSFTGSGLLSSTPRYGLSDLNYYGSFSDAGGCGSMWRPYFASASWDPYGNGMWAFYQGAGYSWVSPYPWGWTPYHSGSWQYCPSQGWGWQPGNSWVSLKNTVLPIRPKEGPPKLGPPKPPTKGGSLIAVNTQPLSLSRQSDMSTFVFVRDSAGLGVPRQTFGKLGGISSSVARNGSASTSLFSAAASNSSAFSSTLSTAAGFASTTHAAAASPSVSSSSFSGGSRGGAAGSSGGGHH